MNRKFSEEIQPQCRQTDENRTVWIQKSVIRCCQRHMDVNRGPRLVFAPRLPQGLIQSCTCSRDFNQQCSGLHSRWLRQSTAGSFSLCGERIYYTICEESYWKPLNILCKRSASLESTLITWAISVNLGRIPRGVHSAEDDPSCLYQLGCPQPLVFTFIFYSDSRNKLISRRSL